MTPEIVLPRLRPIDARPIRHSGQAALLLRDPLQISDRMLIVPQALGPALAMCDGTRDGRAICEAYRVRFGAWLDLEVIDGLLAALDEALLLDNARFAEARDRTLAAYRAAPFRPLAHAGAVYPAAPDELQAMLRAYLDEVDAAPVTTGRGIFSPHIDYARGGAVYAAVWKRAAALARAADLVVLLATDHYGEEASLTLTRQHYATPLGVLPTAQGVVDEVARAIGEARAFAGELRNLAEHSIELVAVWLHGVREGRPVELVPILCGGFGPYVRGEADPAVDATIASALGALVRATAGRNVLYVVSGDLAHVGPAFGGRALTPAARARIRADDEALIGALCAGDAAEFIGLAQRTGDRNNVCGLPPGYLALRALGPGTGTLAGYAHCPADDTGTSLVSVCGAVLG
jgi:AmmeMemoRadiSam system protein B